MFTEKPNPKDKTSTKHKEKTAIKTEQRKQVFTTETRTANTRSKQSCTPNNQCSQHIAALLRMSQETNQLNKAIIELDTALNTMPNLFKQLNEELTIAAHKFRAKKLDAYMDGLEVVEQRPATETNPEANSEITVFFWDNNADKIETTLNKSEANVFFRGIYEKTTEDFKKLEEQFAEFQKHVKKYIDIKDEFKKQLEMAEQSFALFKSLLVDVNMYNDPERPAEQERVIAAHRRNLGKFDQNIQTFEANITRHTQGLSNLAQILCDMEKIIEQNTVSLKFEKFTESTSDANWIFDWIEKNYRRLFETATKEVDKELSEADATLSNLLESLGQRQCSSTTQVRRFKQYTTQEAAMQCAKNFKFEDKNDDHTATLRDILNFTYKSNLDFYTQAQKIVNQNSKCLYAQYTEIFKLVNARKKAAIEMLSNLKSLEPTLTPLVENFILSNLRGGIKVLKTLSAFLTQENMERQTALNHKIEQFLSDNPIKDNPTVAEKTLRSFKAYKLSADPATASEKLDEFEAALHQASKDLLQRKPSPEVLYQFVPARTPVPSPSQDAFKEPSTLKLSEYATLCFQEDKTLLETIECLFDSNRSIRFSEIRKLIDKLRHDDYLTPLGNHVMYRLPNIWQGIALKKQVLVALPHESKADEADIQDPNIRAEIKKGFFEVGLRPQLIRTAIAIQPELPKATRVINSAGS